MNKDALINLGLFVVAVVVVAGAAWYVSPHRDAANKEDYTELIKTIAEREILDYTVIEDAFGNTVQYTYVGDELPEKLAEDEIVFRRTANSFTRHVGTENEGTDEEEYIFETVAYSQQAFIQRNNTWYYIYHDRAPEDAFKKATEPNRVARLFGAVAHAQIFYSTASGDGYVASGIVFQTTPTDTWNTEHDRTVGAIAVADGTTATTTSVSVARVEVTIKSTSYHRQINRVFLPFDTSSIPADASVQAASLNVYVVSKVNTKNDGLDYVTVVQTSQATSTSLSGEDFDQAGTINNPTEGISAAQRKDISSVSTGAYLSFGLNSTGLGWIKKAGATSACDSSAKGITCLGLREGHDTTDTDPGTSPTSYANTLTISTADETGVTQDPYLSIAYTLPLRFAPLMFTDF